MQDRNRPGTEVIVRDTGEIKHIPDSSMVTISETAIKNIAQNVQMAERLVTTVLEREVDFGRTPGTSSDGLWDAGAAKVFNAFNCYVDHQVIFHKDEESLISWCIQANVISRVTQTIVGTGVGAASTKESKNKYRWVDNPGEYGYTTEDIAKLRRRDGKYRIINPDYGDLANTLFQMAAKRAEVDAARGMPGVGGALKKLFDRKLNNNPRKDNPWLPFYTMVARMGLTDENAKELLGVKSMNDWKGTVEQAIEALAVKVANSQTSSALSDKQEDKPNDETVKEQREKSREENSFRTTTDLLRACSEDFGMSSKQVFNELGYANQKEYDAAKVGHYASYLQVKAVRKPDSEENIPF